MMRVFNNCLISFIRSNRDWKNLLSQAPYNLIIKEDADLPNVYLFKYNQYESDMNETICQEARGIILEIVGDEITLLCHSFDKFFNYTEDQGAEVLKNFDWSDYTFQEKRDGSLLRLWYYKDKWRISTSGTIDAFKATIDIPSCPYSSFGDMFIKIFAEKEENYDDLTTFYTYSFEMTSPDNRIVVNYDKDDLTLIGLRDNLLNKEVSIFERDRFRNVKTPTVFKYGDISEALNNINQLKNFEGLVLCDRDFRRVKIKTENYLTLAKLADSARSDRCILELILRGKIDDVKNRLPHIRYKIDRIEQYLRDEIKQARDLVDSIFIHEYPYDRKQIALDTKGNKYQGLIFDKLGYDPVQHYFKVDNIERIYRDYKTQYDVKEGDVDE